MYSVTCSVSGHRRLAYMVVIVQDPIIQGQKYSSCSKAGGCRAAQLLGGFRRNLPIVSWVTPTPGCTAKFNVQGNRYSQPLFAPIWEQYVYGDPQSKNDFTATVPVPKSQENHIGKIRLFMCLPPRVVFVFCRNRGRSVNEFKQIIQGQKYLSCSKAGGCRAAQLLGGFRRNLLIVSWVTPTP